MRSDGKIERIDELNYSMSLRHLSDEDKEKPSRTDSAADIYAFFSYVESALRLHQGHYFPKRANPMYGVFPFARRLKEGAEVINTTKNTTYTIAEVYKSQQIDGNLPTGDVKLEGSPEPSASDRLVFNRDESIKFLPGFPRTYSYPYQFDTPENELMQEYMGDWREAITWSIVRLEPGSLSDEPFKRPRTLRPMHREIQRIAATDRHALDTSAKYYDCLVQFDCWARTNRAAEDLVTWFELFMDTYIPVFTFNGIQRCFYWERTMDELVTRWRNDIVNRSIRYYIRTETVLTRIVSKIRAITINAGLLPSDSISPTGEWIYPTGEYVPVGIYESY